MLYPSETPWRGILDYLAEVGLERNCDDLLGSAISRIRNLVPYDFAHAVFADDKYHFARQRVVDLPDEFADSYPVYYNKLFGRFYKTRLSSNNKLFYTTSKPFMRTAFGADWAKPLGAEYSTGIAIDDERGHGQAILILYRSRCSMGFSAKDREILSLVEPHIANLFHCLSDGRPPVPRLRVEEEVADFRNLSPREKEIVVEICKGASTAALSQDLGISPSTLYRHVNNIYEKLEVSSRQALIAKVLHTG